MLAKFCLNVSLRKSFFLGLYEKKIEIYQEEIKNLNVQAPAKSTRDFRHGQKKDSHYVWEVRIQGSQLIDLNGPYDVTQKCASRATSSLI